jgi:beta-glucosidase
MNKLFKFIILLFIVLLLAYSATTAYFHFKYPQTKWDWSKIDTSEMSFPKDFLWGTATAAHQVEGDNDNSNWAEWEKQKDENGKPRIHNGDVSGKAANQWELYEKDIELMKELGVNSYRFSLAWSKIQPTKDTFNEDALKHYDDVIDALLENDIEPMITLHHFTHPIWFEELGAFEKEENIKYFVEFSKRVFARYKDRVKYWCTFNEPNVFITGAYFNTDFPPGTHNTELGGIVFENILKAHVKTYKELKGEKGKSEKGQKEENLQSPQIGIVQSTFQFEPLRRWHIGDWAIARISSNIFNDTTLSFFRMGQMNYYLPFQTSRTYSDKDAPNTIDFIGLNYYSHYAYKFDLDFRKATQSIAIEGEEMTDMPYTIYTEGIYRAIEEVAQLNKPIIITENGIADAKDDKRGKYIEQSLYAVSKAIKDGYDIRGYYYWSLIDNFEWAEGYSMKFGLYEVDFETQERKLREGSKTYIEIIKKNKTE